MNQTETDFKNSDEYKQAFENWKKKQQPKMPKQYTSTSGKPIYEGQMCEFENEYGIGIGYGYLGDVAETSRFPYCSKYTGHWWHKCEPLKQQYFVYVEKTCLYICKRPLINACIGEDGLLHYDPKEENNIIICATTSNAILTSLVDGREDQIKAIGLGNCGWIN